MDFLTHYGTIHKTRVAPSQVSSKSKSRIVYVFLAFAIMLFGFAMFYRHATMAEAPLAAQVLVGKYNKSIEEEVNRAGVLFSEMSCRLSKRVNAENIVSYQDNLGQIWGSACGLNRGIFTLAKYPGKTFNCGKLPEDWNAPNGVSDLFKPGRDMIADLGYLDDYMGGVFNTTAGIGPSSCAFQNLAHLWCGEKRFMPWRRTPWASRLGHKPLRGVNLGGLFVLEPWICPGFADWGDEIRDQYTYCKNESVSLSTKTNKLKDHWASFYSEDDFKLMSKYGINTARMPVGWWYFAEATGLDPLHYITPDNDIMVDMDHPITKVISWAYKHNIQIILDLHGAPGSQNGLDNSGIRSMDPDAERWGDNWFFSEDFREMTVMTLKTMTHYINMLNKNGLSNVIMLELMNEPWVFGDMSVVRDFYVDAVTEIRKINNTLPILVCDAFRHDEWHWLLRRRGFSFENIYMDTHLYHAFNPSDVASDNPHDDMMKQITASDMACGYGSLLRYKTCSSLPTMTGEWSLAIDDCMKFLTGSTSSANQFTDFGQCKNLKERNTPQWTALIKDFAARQRAVFEKELGWVFWTWKVDKEASKDISAPLWSYSMAVEAGYFPDNLNTEADVTKGCDHPVDLTKVVLPPPVTN